MCGLTAALCTMSAIVARQIKGSGGQHIDLSQQEALASVGRQELAFYAVEVMFPPDEGERREASCTRARMVTFVSGSVRTTRRLSIC
jgi:crotonobetainyl-CoA:carnitine CoA-transferase CaiB-like acyl-CoA transferase